VDGSTRTIGPKHPGHRVEANNPRTDVAACPVRASQSWRKSVQTPEGHGGDFELVGSEGDGKPCQ